MRWHGRYKVVSFYTPDYAVHAARLRESVEELLPGVPHEIEPIEQRKWAEATCYKATFLREKLESTDRPLVWIDADAAVVGPGLEFPDADFAVYGRFEDGSPTAARYSPIRTGTVYLGDTKAAKLLVNLWADESTRQTDGVDQWSLFRAWFRAVSLRRTIPRTVWLPLSYCQKFDEDGGRGAKVVHFMASRDTRSRK